MLSTRVLRVSTVSFAIKLRCRPTLFPASSRFFCNYMTSDANPSNRALEPTPSRRPRTWPRGRAYARNGACDLGGGTGNDLTLTVVP